MTEAAPAPTRRFPLVPTILVILCVAAMVALGVWQLERQAEKEALLARFAVNAHAPVAALPPVLDDTWLFRRVSLFCLEPTEWSTAGAGAAGFRHIAQCRLGAEGPVMAVDIGTARDPEAKPDWRGGKVTGTLTTAPSTTPALWRWIAGARPDEPMMVVAEAAAPGLSPSPRPDPASVPNNHLAYAVQWFLFAGVALIIYALALRNYRRRVEERS